MCVVSMVHDHFTVPFDQWTIPGQNTTFTPTGPADLTPHLEEIKQLIKDFRAAVEAAALVDKLTKQPDCVDPEKAKLEARIKDIEKKSKKRTKKVK